MGGGRGGVVGGGGVGRGGGGGGVGFHLSPTPDGRRGVAVEKSCNNLLYVNILFQIRKIYIVLRYIYYESNFFFFFFFFEVFLSVVYIVFYFNADSNVFIHVHLDSCRFNVFYYTEEIPLSINN